ncbi:MAG: hypothetical protein LC790_14035 [Actinobacteria bacterium]|nr:hypothetical protein [Actinomycetota bacterium]
MIAWALQERDEPGLRSRRRAERFNTDEESANFLVLGCWMAGLGGVSESWHLGTLEFFAGAGIGFGLANLAREIALRSHSNSESHRARWRDFRANHPGSAALLQQLEIPCSALALIAILPNSLTAKLVLALAMIGVTVGFAVLRLLGWNQDEKEVIEASLAAHHRSPSS